MVISIPKYFIQPKECAKNKQLKEVYSLKGKTTVS